MLIKTFFEISGQRDPGTGCDFCHDTAVIKMIGYGADRTGECNWCTDCAMQLVRMIMEDLCQLLTKGGRHG